MEPEKSSVKNQKFGAARIRESRIKTWRSRNENSKQNEERADHELEALRERVYKPGRQKNNSRQTMAEFRREEDRSFPLMAHLNAAIFVIFDRKFEFVNDDLPSCSAYRRTTACSSNFDPLTLIAPESSFLSSDELYQAGYRRLLRGEGVEVYRSFRRMGSRRETARPLPCSIPDKRGVAIQGNLLHGGSVRPSSNR